MKICSRALRLRWRSTFQQDNNPKHTAKTMQEWLREKSLNVFEWPSQSPDLNSIEYLWRDLKITVQWRSPSNPIGREEWEKLPRYRCAKLVASYPRRRKAVIVAKGASTKNWVNGLNTYVNVIILGFLKLVFALSLWGIVMSLWVIVMSLWGYCDVIIEVLCVDCWGFFIYLIHFRIKAVM